MTVIAFKSPTQQRRIVVIGCRTRESVRLDILPPVYHASFRASFATAHEAVEAANKLSRETGWRVFDATGTGPLSRKAGR